MPRVYVVDAPMECPDDLTLRARRVLGAVLLIVVPAGAEAYYLWVHSLLARYGLQTPTYELLYCEAEKMQPIWEALGHGDVAWVWGGAIGAHGAAWAVLRALCERGVDLISVPGPSAEIAALAASGLPAGRLTFLGLLPPEAKARQAWLRRAADEHDTVVCDAPAESLAAVLEDVLLTLGDRRLVLMGDGVVWRGKPSQPPAIWEKGILTLVIGGAAPTEAWNEEQVREQVRGLLAEGRSARDIVHDIAARSGWPRRRVYAVVAKLHSA